MDRLGEKTSAEREDPKGPSNARQQSEECWVGDWVSEIWRWWMVQVVGAGGEH